MAWRVARLRPVEVLWFRAWRRRGFTDNVPRMSASADRGTSTRSAAAGPRIGLVLSPGGLEDPYDAQILLGLERALHEFGLRGRVLTPSPREGFVPSLQLLARQGHDLVIGTGMLAVPAVVEVAARFPGQRFAIVDAAPEVLDGAPGNVTGLVFSDEEVGYLAGFLAARMAALEPGQPVVSAVGGVRQPVVERLIASYEAGARRAVPGIETLCAYTDDFLNPAKGRAAAFGQIAKGSRVVFQVAGACGLGALDAAREAGVWGIGVDTDQSALGEHMLTSAVKRLDLAVLDAVRRHCEGALQAGEVRFSLANGAVGLGRMSPRVPANLVQEIEALMTEITEHGIDLPVPVR
jgi:basic membrane protein A